MTHHLHVDQIPTRAEVIRRHKEQGGGIAAVYPIHYSRALLRAHGLLPVEVWGPPGRDTTSGDTHLQPYTCSIVRCGLSFLLDGGLESADVLVVPHACDSLQGLASILLDFVKPRQAVLPLYMPRGEGEGQVQFLTEELRKMSGSLSEATGNSPSDDEIAICIDREEMADAGLADLYRQRPGLPFSNREFYRLIRTREYLPAEDFTTIARRALTAAADSPSTGTPVLLSGLVPEPMSVLDALDEAGVVIAADDLACAGRRLYKASTDADPYRRMAESLLSAPADSTRGSAIDARAAHLLAQVERTGARGVIFFDVKFCEPELFYLPLLERHLTEAGVRTLALEVDVADSLSDQIVTRIEAFAETLA